MTGRTICSFQCDRLSGHWLVADRPPLGTYRQMGAQQAQNSES